MQNNANISKPNWIKSNVAEIGTRDFKRRKLVP